MKIFVLHYSKLVERKQNILQQFSKQNITNYEFIELFDKDVLTNEHKKLFIPDFKPSMMSLMLKHFHVYKEIAEKLKPEIMLLLEKHNIESTNVSLTNFDTKPAATAPATTPNTSLIGNFILLLRAIFLNFW